MAIPLDESLGLLYHWPLVVIVLDGYEPALARIVCETISEIKDESVFSVMFNVACERAREGVRLN